MSHEQNLNSYSILSKKEIVVKVLEANEMSYAEKQAKRSFARLLTSTIG
jgi:hypothetical protein